jgi:hypothetical protein
MLVQFVIPARKSQRQEDHEFKASLSYKSSSRSLWAKGLI